MIFFTIKKFFLNWHLNFLFLENKSIFVLKSFLGITYFYLPSFFFFYKKEDFISFIFLKKFFFKSFISHFFYKYLSLYLLYIVRLRMRGLGFQIIKITNNIFHFIFNILIFFIYFYL
jgi:hypothetical protein